MQMSIVTQVMDADDLRDADWAIIEELRDGRNNAPNIADATGYTRQYLAERIRTLKMNDIVTPLGHGLYELNPENVPGEREEDDEE